MHELGDVTILRASPSRLMRRAFSRVFGPMLALFVVVAVVIWLGINSSNHYRVLAGFGGYIVIWSTCWAAALLVIARFTGYYASGREIGSIVGRTLRPAEPGVVRWVRRTLIITPSRGRARRHRVVYGLDAEGRRVLTIGTEFMRLQDVERFLEATGVATEGDWSAEVTRKQMASLHPEAHPVSATQARRRVRIFLAALAAVLLGSLGLAVLTVVLVGR